MAASSVLSSSGVSASSRFSLASRACSLSRWLLTDTYSPSAIDTAPATRPAIPAVKIAPRVDVAPATPTTIPATETIPSLAPRTPARSQFSFAARPPECGSPEWVAFPSATASTCSCSGLGGSLELMLPSNTTGGQIHGTLLAITGGPAGPPREWGLVHEPSWWFQERAGSRFLFVLVHRGMAPRPRSVNPLSSCRPSCRPRRPRGLHTCGSTMKADARQGEAEAAERATAATEAVLALAQKLHDQYVAEGQETRERLISEGQSRHDQVVGEATARQEELLSTGQAKYDEFVSAGKAKHDELIAEAEALVVEAQHKRAEVLAGLGSERGVLQKEIEELRTIERDHRTRLKSYLEGQLIKLEQTGADETS